MRMPTRTMAPSTFTAIAVALSLCFLQVTHAQDAPSPHDGIRTDYQAILTARDALVKQLSDRQRADAAKGPPRDFDLRLHGAIIRGTSRADIECVAYRRGTTWYGGFARARNYNLAKHDVEASGLKVDGDRLTGVLRITLQPDPWVPPDHKPKDLRITLDAKIKGDTVEGSYEVEGDYDAGKGKVTGNATQAPQTITLPEDTDLPDKPLAAALAMGTQGTRCYQQARAVAMCMRHYPLPFDEALEVTALAPPQWPAQEDALPHVHRYLSRIRSLMERQLKRAADADTFTIDSIEVDDPLFGPYFDDLPLPSDQSGIALLPADTGKTGSQRWQRIPRWQTIAAFAPDTRRELDTPGLPEIIHAPGARYAPDREKLEGYRPPGDGGTFAWVEHEAPFRFIPPPGQPFDPVYHHRGRGRSSGSGGVHGAKTARWYGFTQVKADRDIEIHASALGADYGKLWVNDALTWVGRTEAKDGPIDPPLFKIQLRKGVNTLLFACQSRKGTSYFWVMLSTGAGPKTGEQRAAERASQREATASLPPDPRRGRRGDWTARFPDADPPLAWEIHSGTNVLWRTPMPSYSAANPIVVGDKVFTNCEPHTLYCLDKNTGEILWKRDSHIVEFAPEEERARLIKAWNAGYEAGNSRDRRELTNQLAELENELRELDEAGDLTEEKEKEAQAAIDKLNAKLDKIKNQNRTYRSLQRRFGVQDHGWNNNYGWTFPAPCSDGEHVWVKHNTGVLACYDLQGNRKWMKRTHMSGGVAQLPSPILADGKVIIQGALSDRRALEDFIGTAGSPPYFRHKLMAFDKKTGDVVWERPVWASGGYGCPGGVVSMRLSDGKRTRELIFTSTGLVIDPRDGRMLSSVLGVGRQCYYSDPFVIENRAYIYRSHPVSVAEVWLEPDGRVGSKIIMQIDKGGGNAGAAYADGYVFGSNGHPSSGRTPVPWHDVHVADTRTGQVIGSIVPALRRGGLAYTPAASAGKYGVVIGTGPGSHSWSISDNPAELGFLIPGPVPYMASTCLLDGPMIAQPVFEGDRMYVRTYKSIMCMAVTTEKGREFALRNKARTILQNLAVRPDRPEVIRATPPEGFEPTDGVPVEACNIQTAPGNWLFVGPFDNQPDKKPVDAMGGPAAALLRPGQDVTFAGKTIKVAALDGKYVQAGSGWSLDPFDRRHFSANNTIDVVGPISHARNSVTYYYTVIRTDQPRFVEVMMRGGKGYSAWLGGQAVLNGSVVRLAPGHHAILIQMEIGVIPTFVKQVISFRLRDVQDPSQAYTDWLKEMQIARPRLEQIIEDIPRTAEARAASLVLRELDEGADE